MRKVIFCLTRFVKKIPLAELAGGAILLFLLLICLPQLGSGAVHVPKRRQFFPVRLLTGSFILLLPVFDCEFFAAEGDDYFLPVSPLEFSQELNGECETHASSPAGSGEFSYMSFA
jgi:hypothetical protein